MIEYGDERLPERFWIKVYPCPMVGCWLWGGATKKRGNYGSFQHNGQARPVSHVLAEIKYGDSWDREKFGPAFVCGNNWCANPEHVFLRDLSLCRNGHKKDKHGRGNTCLQCRRNVDARRREIKKERRTYTTNKPKPKKVSVFGDPIPSKPWRPASFAEKVTV